MRELDDNRVGLGRAEKTLKETRERAARRKRTSLDHNRRLGTQVAICERVVQKAQENAYKRKCKELKASRKFNFRELAAAQRREECRMLLLMKKNERLEDRLKQADDQREAAITAHSIDIAIFEHEREEHEAQHSALQGSLEFATAEHHIHVAHCERQSETAAERLEALAAELDATRRMHANQLAAGERRHEQRASILQARIAGLEDRVASATATRDAIAASYKAHVEHTNAQLTTHETQYTALEGSLAFSTVEHKIHMEHCTHERSVAKSRIEELTAQLAAERAARAEAEANYDGLQTRHKLVSEGYAHSEAKLKTIQRKLYLAEERSHATVMAYRAGQDVADTLIDSLVVEQSTRATRAGRTRRSQVKSMEPYPEQLTDTLPPSTLFDDSWLDPQPKFIEGSSRDGSSATGSTAATSTAYTIEQPEDSVKLVTTLPQSTSMQSLYPSPPPSGSTATLDLEPSLPPVPSQSFEDTTASSVEDEPTPSATLVATEIRPERPQIQPAASFPSLKSEPSLPPPPDLDLSTSQFAFDPYLSPASSTSDLGVQLQLPDPESTPVPDTTPSHPPSSAPRNLASHHNFELGNESFGANVVTNSTPIFTRGKASASESPSRDMSMSRSSIKVRVSDLFTQGLGFKTSGSRVVDDVAENV